MKMINKLLFGAVVILLITTVNAQNEAKANCSEQLQILLNEYNNLTEDYHSGTNCGTIKYILADNNKLLGERLEECREDLGGLKSYRTGYFLLFVLLTIITIVLIYNSFKQN